MIRPNHTTVPGSALAVEPLPTQAAFVKQAERQLEDWGAHIEHLTAQAAKLSADAKAEADQQVAQLKSKLALARQRLQASEAVASEKWLEAKAGMDSLWSEVKALFDKHGDKV